MYWNVEALLHSEQTFTIMSICIECIQLSLKVLGQLCISSYGVSSSSIAQSSKQGFTSNDWKNGPGWCALGGIPNHAISVCN